MHITIRVITPLGIAIIIQLFVCSAAEFTQYQDHNRPNDNIVVLEAAAVSAKRTYEPLANYIINVSGNASY